jgi:hypothetical protein
MKKYIAIPIQAIKVKIPPITDLISGFFLYVKLTGIP